MAAPRAVRLLRWAALVLWLTLPQSSPAAPYVPLTDDTVLERLPAAARDPTARRLEDLRRELSLRPTNLDVAVRTAELYVEQGRALSDPRYYGYAQAALAPWWNEPRPSVPILVLRATIRQHDHDFDAALGDLSAALQLDPMNARAWLTNAIVLQVQGRYAEAERSCREVLQLASPLVAVTCLSSLNSLRGEAAHSYAVLRKAIAKGADADNTLRGWALTALAEIAARAGNPAAAELHFNQARRMIPTDQYLLGAFADFLLDQKRPDEVRSLLVDYMASDALLLRLALADAQTAAPALDERVALLNARYAAARLRGGTAHRREEARFALHLAHQPAAALALARENWTLQREPADARILLEAAVATGNLAAAQPAVAFLVRNATEDPTLTRLLAQVSR